MQKFTKDIEMNIIKGIAGTFKRHPGQLNNICEADAEILDFKDQEADYLVFKTDGIKEEINEGLYEDPYLIGWMAVTVTVSDLAAVGSEPIGILLNLNIPANPSNFWVENFKTGINEACNHYNVPVLGGDTNFDPALSISSTGIATLSGKKPMMRKNIHPGDLLYATGKFGQGSAFAYSRLINSSTKIDYKPYARLKESWKIREFATACIDTSDGVFPALSVLCNLNQIGVKIKNPIQQLLCNRSLAIYNSSPVPAWMFLAGPHGEYELIFSIPPSNKKRLELLSHDQNFPFIFLGEVIEDKKIAFITEGMGCISEISEISNMFYQVNGNVQEYYKMLFERHNQWLNKETAII
jgi:thiamine-monophosphate kinase